MLSKSMLVFAGLAAFAASAPTPVRQPFQPIPAGFTGGRAFNNDVRNALAPQKRSLDLDDYERLVAEIPGYRRRYAALGKRDDHDDEEDCDDTPEPEPTSPPGGGDDDDDDCDSQGGDDDDDDDDCDSDDGGNDDDCVDPDPDSDDDDDDDDCDDEPPVSGGGSAPEPEPNTGSGDCKKQYTVKAGDNCSKVATDHSITLAQFYKWNPSLDDQCMNLELGQAYCIEM